MNNENAMEAQTVTKMVTPLQLLGENLERAASALTAYTGENIQTLTTASYCLGQAEFALRLVEQEQQLMEQEQQQNR